MDALVVEFTVLLRAGLETAASALRRRAKEFFAVIMLGAAVLPVSTRAQPSPSQDASIAIFPAGAFQILAVIGRDSGIFEKHKIKPKLLELTTGPLLNSAIVSGQATFGGAIFQGATSLAFQGEDILFLTGDAGPLFNLIATKASGINSVQGLKGKRIGVTGRGAFTEFFARAVLQDAGLNPETDVTFIATGGVATSITAFDAGLIDGLVSFPPMEPKIGANNFTMLVDNVKTKKFFRDMSVDGYATTHAALKKNPELVANFCRAIWETFDYSRDPKNLQSVAKTISAVLGISGTQAEEFWKQSQDIYNLELSEDRWKAQGKYIQGPYANKMPSYDQFVHKPCASRPVPK